ncbi:MAG: hypothetical protein ACE5G1_10195 [bacterium]
MKAPTLFLVASLALPIGLNAQENSMRAVEQQFHEVESKLVALADERNEFKTILEKKAGEIQKLQNKTNLNYFQRQKLEGLLKDSQDLSTKIRSVDAKLTANNKKLKDLGRKLLEIYEFEIRKSLANLETKELAQSHRKTILKNIERLRRKKETVKRQINRKSPPEIRLSPLTIEPDDTPKQIEQKADLLKDQEDKFRALADKLAQQRKDLKKELNLRNRIDDLVADLALFDQQEEILSNLSPQTSGSRNLNIADESQASTDVGEAKVPGETDLFFVGQKDFDFSVLSSEQLEEILLSLEKQEQRAKARADSLRKQADTFYGTAKELKK